MTVRRRVLVLATALLATGCSTTYYAQPGVNGHRVTAGSHSGPRGDRSELHPAVAEFIFAQKESNLARYYEVALARRDERGSPATKAMYDSMRADLAVLEPRLREVTLPEGVPQYEHFARLVGKIVAAPSIRSIRDHHYARVTWGKKVEADGSGLKQLDNTVVVTTVRDHDVVCFFHSDPTEITKLWPTSYDVSAVDGAWSTEGDLTFESVGGTIERHEEPHQACIEALASDR